MKVRMVSMHSGKLTPTLRKEGGGGGWGWGEELVIFWSHHQSPALQSTLSPTAPHFVPVDTGAPLELLPAVWAGELHAFVHGVNVVHQRGPALEHLTTVIAAVAAAASDIAAAAAAAAAHDSDSTAAAS